MPGRRGGMAAMTGISGRQRDGREHEARSRPAPREAAAVQPASRARTASGADSVRRRLSSIFQRPIAGTARGDSAAPALRPAAENPRQQLPVAARPAVVAQGADIVARRKFLDDLDIGGEAGAGEHALEQIVAEQRRIRRAAGQRGLESVDVVDALAGIGAFAEQVLIDVGNRRGVGIDAAQAGEDALEQRAFAARPAATA